MLNKPNSFSDLISHWDRIADFARDVGCGYEAARQMKRRDSIAPEHWGAVVEACEKRGLRGVNLSLLTSMRSRARDAA